MDNLMRNWFSRRRADSAMLPQQEIDAYMRKASAESADIAAALQKLRPTTDELRWFEQVISQIEPGAPEIAEYVLGQITDLRLSGVADAEINDEFIVKMNASDYDRIRGRSSRATLWTLPIMVNDAVSIPQVTRRCAEIA